MAFERSDAGSARLAWPPLAEDLKRLYLEQKLSASKIATAYGLKYASAKTAESTILYHLKKNGISRRDPAAHIRKVTETMVDEWIVRYQKGESLKQIAGDAVDRSHRLQPSAQARPAAQGQGRSANRGRDNSSRSSHFTGDAARIGVSVGVCCGRPGHWQTWAGSAGKTEHNPPGDGEHYSVPFLSSTGRFTNIQD